MQNQGRENMETKIAVVETEVKNVHARLIDYWNDVKAMRVAWNATTGLLLLLSLYLFFWIDNKSDAKFSNLMTEIKASNESVNTQISEMKIEMVKMSHAISGVKEDHDKRFKEQK
jgi:hypothetical protein